MAEVRIHNSEQPEADRPTGIKGERTRNIENIYNKYHRQLVSFAVHRLIDSGINENEALNDSEDMVGQLYKSLLDTPSEMNFNKPEAKTLARLSQLLEKVIANYVKEQNVRDRIPKSELVQMAQLRGRELRTTNPEEDIIETSNVKTIFTQDLQRLSPRERKVIKMRFGLPPYDGEYILDDVGLALDVTRERIRQIEAKALRKLRGYSALRAPSPQKQKEVKAEVKVEPESKEVIVDEELPDDSNDDSKLDRYRTASPLEQKFFSERIKQISSKEGEFVSLEKRRQSLTEIKATILNQQRGLGLFIKDVYNSIYQDTKISYEQIQKTLDEYSTKYSFSDDQLIQINTVLKEFWEKHLVTAETREKYENNPQGLFELCFDRSPKAPVRVIYGPMTVTLILSDADYNFAYSGREGQDSWEWAKRSGGAALEHSRGRLWGIVNIVRATQDSGTIPHEDQHQFNRLFVPKEDRQQLSQAFLESVVERESNQKARRQKITYALAKNVRKQTVDTRARDEILAQLRNKKDTDYIYEIIAKNPLYQYFTQNDIDSKSESIRKVFKNLKGGGSDEHEKWIEGHQKTYLNLPRYKLSSKAWNLLKIPTTSEVAAQTNLAYQRYYEDLKEALNAVKDLQKSGMDNSEIIPLLYTMPMDRWGVFARRFLKDLPPRVETLEQVEAVVKQAEIPTQTREIRPKKWYEKLFDYGSLWPTKGGGGGHGGHH